MLANFLISNALITVALFLPFLLLWNWLVPDLFGLPQINWLQAIALVFLARIIFGNSPNVDQSGQGETDLQAAKKRLMRELRF